MVCGERDEHGNKSPAHDKYTIRPRGQIKDKKKNRLRGECSEHRPPCWARLGRVTDGAHRQHQNLRTCKRCQICVTHPRTDLGVRGCTIAIAAVHTMYQVNICQFRGCFFRRDKLREVFPRRHQNLQDHTIPRRYLLFYVIFTLLFSPMGVQTLFFGGRPVTWYQVFTRTRK